MEVHYALRTCGVSAVTATELLRLAWVDASIPDSVVSCDAFNDHANNRTAYAGHQRAPVVRSNPAELGTRRFNGEVSMIAQQGTSLTAVWVVVAVAAIPAAASIMAAVLAARSARRTAAQVERAERERRVADHRADVYRPFLETLRSVFDAVRDSDAQVHPDEIKRRLSEFGTWLAIYGSEESVLTFHRFMQGAFTDAPASVAIRHYYDLMLAARRDLGHSDTDVTALELAGFRINDLYADDTADAFRLPRPKLYEREGWVPPWRGSRLSERRLN